MSGTFSLFANPRKMSLPWPRLCLVNPKNVLWGCPRGPEGEVAEWRPYWTRGRPPHRNWRVYP